MYYQEWRLVVFFFLYYYYYSEVLPTGISTRISGVASYHGFNKKIFSIILLGGHLHIGLTEDKRIKAMSFFGWTMILSSWVSSTLIRTGAVSALIQPLSVSTWTIPFTASPSPVQKHQCGGCFEPPQTAAWPGQGRRTEEERAGQDATRKRQTVQTGAQGQREETHTEGGAQEIKYKYTGKLQENLCRLYKTKVYFT